MLSGAPIKTLLPKSYALEGRCYNRAPRFSLMTAMVMVMAVGVGVGVAVAVAVGAALEHAALDVGNMVA
jgi:hypothetical protein